MIPRRKVFGIFTGFVAAVAALPAIASTRPKKWSGKTVSVTMKVDDELLQGFANDSEILDDLLSNMQSSMATYINTGKKE